MQNMWCPGTILFSFISTLQIPCFRVHSTYSHLEELCTVTAICKKNSTLEHKPTVPVTVERKRGIAMQHLLLQHTALAAATHCTFECL